MYYSIHITSKVEADIQAAADYIGFVLLNPDASDLLLDTLNEEISNLSSMPAKHQFVEDPVLASWDIRMISVKNYLAFYVINETESTVHIVRFPSEKRSWAAILRRDPVSSE